MTVKARMNFILHGSVPSDGKHATRLYIHTCKWVIIIGTALH